MMKYIATLLFLFVSLASCDHFNDPCHVLHLANSYDAVVVGSGPGGSVSARRLAEHQGRQVLQVERGPYYSDCPLCSPADAGVGVAFEPGFSLSWNLAPQAYIPGNPVIANIEAAVQGGASSHNGMVWIRPDGRNYFNNYFPPNWNWEAILPYFAKVENYTFPNGFYGPGNHFDYAANSRGKTGLVQVTQLDTTYSGGFEKAFIEKSKIVWPNIPAFENSSINNGFFGGSGVSPPEESFHGSTNGIHGTRSSGYTSYIQSYPGHNLRAIANVRVNKILFTGTQVSGVQLVFVNSTGHANSSTCTVFTKNVVVSAGPFGTPKLLLLSGIGPAHDLHRLGISVVVDSPQVGQGLDNQFSIGITTLSPNSISAWQAPGFLFYNVQDDLSAPNNFNINMDILNIPPSTTYFSLVGAALCYGTSRGNVTLSSANPDDPPAVTFNFLSTEADKNTTAQILAKTLQLVNLLGLTLLSDPCAAPGADCSTPLKQLNVWLSAGATSLPAHWTSAAALGRVLDPLTAGVHNTHGLYVLDSSALPAAPGSNTQLSTYALAEKGIELVINDIENRCGW